LPTPAWTYSDWITFATGSASRLTQLRFHIKEIADFISTGNFSVESKSHDKDALQAYLSQLLEREESEAVAAGTTAGTRTAWTRGKCL
jgi:hypothetical protein